MPNNTYADNKMATKKPECIAITDHNDYRGIDEIKQLCEENDIIAFPGVELSCDSSKVHLLILECVKLFL